MLIGILCIPSLSYTYCSLWKERNLLLYPGVFVFRSCRVKQIVTFVLERAERVETVHHAPPSTHRRCSLLRTQGLEDLTGIHAMNGGTKKKMVESCSIL